MDTTIQHKKNNTPTSMVIFGVTGDLAKRKLIPALWNLFSKSHLPDQFTLIGFARREWSSLDLQKYVRTILEEKYPDINQDELTDFLSKIIYVTGNFDTMDDYKKLANILSEIDSKIGVCGAKLFHLSVPPNFYEEIFENLHTSGLSDMCGTNTGWTRILVEKPFGNDWYSAENLDQKLGKLFKEEQIFRVDHYMGKESIQNILTFRFSNALLEHLWSNLFIEKVHIRLWEKIGVETRGSFYDTVGALRDVGQNHVLQMLAFIAMEDPGMLDTKAIRTARTKVIDNLQSITKENIDTYVKRGQYESYTKEPNVREDSTTETYFNIESYIDNSRWKGVPFYLEGGKRLAENLTEIEIVFRKKDSCICPPGKEMHPQNSMIFRIQPNEGISISFWAKKPGLTMELEQKTLSFNYQTDEGAIIIPDAYEKVIHDCILGDQTLFASTEEVLASWKYITPIIENWDHVSLTKYESGWLPNKN